MPTCLYVQAADGEYFGPFFPDTEARSIEDQVVREGHGGIQAILTEDEFFRKEK